METNLWHICERELAGCWYSIYRYTSNYYAKNRKARKLRKENKLKKIAETKNIEEKGKNESEISGTGKPVVDNSDDLDPDAGNNN